MAKSLEPIWEQFLQLAKEEVGSNTVETWFKAVSLYEWDAIKKTAYLIAPNVFVKDWLYNNYMNLFAMHLGRLFGIIDIIIIIYTNAKEKKGEIPQPEHAEIQKNGPEERFKPAHIATTQAQKSAPLIKTGRPERSAFLNESYRFDNFIVGQSNEFACAAAHAVTEHPGTLYNPLFIYGASGLGKTHLLHAIGHASYVKQKQVLYQTADRFVSEFINAIRMNQMLKFQKKYHHVDVLLIDDIQFMAHKDQTQEAFFHLFNTLYDAHKQIVFTCDAYPHALEGIAERLKSRLASGLIVDIKEPHLETKIAIIKKKIESHSSLLSDDVIQYVAEHSGKSIRELQGLVTRILAFASLTKTPITIELAQQMCLRQQQNEPKTEANSDILTIIKSVAKYYTHSYEELRSRDRAKDIVRARHVAMFLIKQFTKKSLRDIALFFDSKSHATVKHAITSIEHGLQSDTVLFKQIKDLEMNLGKKATTVDSI